MMMRHRFDRADEGEDELWDAFRNEWSGSARHKLFTAYSGYAAALGWRFYRRHSFGDLEIGDIHQLAFTGLLESIDRFDPARGVPFKAFAAHRITGCVRDGVARMTEVREQLSWRHRLRRERIKSLEVRDVGGTSGSDVLGIMADVAIGLALGYMLEDTGMMMADEERAAAQPSAYESSAWRQLLIRLQAEFALLPQREAMLLKHHYVDALSFDQIAKLLSLSNARISQLHKHALMMLKKRLAASGHFKLEN